MVIQEHLNYFGSLSLIVYAEYPDMTRLKPPAPSASLSHCFSVSVHHLGFKTCLVRTVCRNKHCSCDTFECTEMMNGLDVLVTRHLQYGVVATVLDPLVLFRAIYYFLLCLLAGCVRIITATVRRLLMRLKLRKYTSRFPTSHEGSFLSDVCTYVSVFCSICMHFK